MLTYNPFENLALVVPALAMQLFVILMVILVVVSTVLDILQKNVIYFLEMQKKLNCLRRYN